MALPKYENKDHITFLQDMKRAKRRVFHFEGNGFWKGPAVKIIKLTELYDICDETSVVTHYEQDANGYVVHPYSRG